MPHDEFLESARIRHWVGDQTASTLMVIGQLVGDYFNGSLRSREMSSEAREAVRAYAHLSLHDFLLKVRAKEPETVHAFDFLCMIRRAPFNHLPVLAVLYDAAPDE